jgi:hypothetical protein
MIDEHGVWWTILYWAKELLKDLLKADLPGLNLLPKLSPNLITPQEKLFVELDKQQYKYVVANNILSRI